MCMDEKTTECDDILVKIRLCTNFTNHTDNSKHIS